MRPGCTASLAACRFGLTDEIPAGFPPTTHVALDLRFVDSVFLLLPVGFSSLVGRWELQYESIQSL